MGKIELTYTKQGDYLFPNIIADLILEKTKDNNDIPLGKFGELRKKYLKEHKEAKYMDMLMANTLWKHLRDIDKRAYLMREKLMEQLMERYGVTEELKKQDQLKWISEVTTIKLQADEIILQELIYQR